MSTRFAIASVTEFDGATRLNSKVKKYERVTLGDSRPDSAALVATAVTLTLLSGASALAYSRLFRSHAVGKE